MFVIADIEWVTYGKGKVSPTQLAAVKTDERWNVTERFASLIRPSDEVPCDRGHMAFTGAAFSEFQSAKSADRVFAEFAEWLSADDVILWWHEDSDAVFRKLSKRVCSNESVCIGKHIYDYLKNGVKGAYALAASLGIDADRSLMHCSANDVSVMQRLLQKLEYPHGDLQKPPSVVRESRKAAKALCDLPYRFDPASDTVHRKDCPLIGGEAFAFGKLKKLLTGDVRPCACCKEEYKTARREKNADTISRSGYTYIYTSTSTVFHKRSCGTMLSAKSILGAAKYATALKTGRTPCKLCNPTPHDEIAVVSSQPKKELEKKTEHKIDAECERALRRQKIAAKERRERLKGGLTNQERADILTLTQPSFAFWSARGYGSFHLRSCPKLNGLSDLRGFGTYREAVRMGLTPCRKCKPTAKHDLRLSVPITNKTRKGEKVDDLKELCSEAGYAQHMEDGYFCIETPVGKWRIRVNVTPVRAEHINLVKTPGRERYHEQPRLFLSLTDAFAYIRKHDENLKRAAAAGTVFAILPK